MDASNSITTDDVTPLTIFTVWDTLLYVKETELGGRSKSLIFSLLKNSQNRSSQKDISRGFILGFFVLIKIWVAKVRARTHTCDVRSHECVCVRNDL